MTKFVGHKVLVVGGKPRDRQGDRPRVLRLRRHGDIYLRRVSRCRCRAGRADGCQSGLVRCCGP